MANYEVLTRDQSAVSRPKDVTRLMLVTRDDCGME